MHRDLHRYLDGELSRDELAPDLRADAEAWDALLSEAGELREATAPPWLESRVMSALPREPVRPLGHRLWRWLVEPQSIRIRPIVGLVGAAAAMVLLARPAAPPPPVPATVVATDGTAAAPAQAEPAPTIYVQFHFTGGDARSVAVAGDFNDWDPRRHVLRDPDGDGVWTGLFALPPGLHKYMFLVDGEQWVTDPGAERYVDDGFGMRNALIAVAAPGGRAS